MNDSSDPIVHLELPGVPEPSGLCANCKTREATILWCGDGGSLAFVHGMYENWCEVCGLEAQIKHAQKAIARLPELVARAERALERAKDQPK